MIKGTSYPLEVHLVHADKDGNLAVIAVMFNEGKAHPALVNAEALLPADRDYYRFNGSLTTPPCSEGVRWLVMKESVSASKEQIAAFARVIHHANNRPVQATNARAVLN